MVTNKSSKNAVKALESQFGIAHVKADALNKVLQDSHVIGVQQHDDTIDVALSPDTLISYAPVLAELSDVWTFDIFPQSNYGMLTLGSPEESQILIGAAHLAGDLEDPDDEESFERELSFVAEDVTEIQNVSLSNVDVIYICNPSMKFKSWDEFPEADRMMPDSRVYDMRRKSVSDKVKMLSTLARCAENAIA